jgi:PAS domain S-box-containing protein
MVANTGACFVLIGVSLWLLQRRHSRSQAWAGKLTAKSAAAIASTVGLLSLSEHLCRVDLGIDQLLFAVPPAMETATARPGLMSPITAGAFLLLGLALLGMDWPTRRGLWPAQFLSLTAGGGATFGVLTFAFDPHIYRAHLSLALPTSITLALLSLGLVCARPERGLGALLCSQSLGGSLARRLLPAAFIPVLVGGIRWRITATGLYSEWSVVVFSSLVTMSLLAGIIAWAAVVVGRNDMKQRAVEETREHLAAVVDSSDDAIISKDLSGTINAWNRGAEKIFGYSASEAVGQPMLMLFPPDRVEEESDILARIGRGEGVEHFETVRVRKDGKRINISATISPIKDSGTIIGASKIARDITERKQTEERLAGQAEELSRQAEELLRSRLALEAQSLMLRSVLDSMAEGLVAADEQGKFIIWNPAAARILGLGATNLPSQEWTVHYGLYLEDMTTPFPTDQLPLVRAIRGEASTAQMFVRNPELEEGTWIEASGGPLKDKDGAVRGGVVAFRDISQRRADEQEIRKLNEELEERVVERTAQLAAANHELEAFTYSVSHDLRAPLRHIGGFSRILIEDFGATMPPEAQSHVQRIEDGVHRMGLLVDELLNLARVGRHALNLQPTRLNSVIAEVVSLLQPEVAGRSVDWKIANLPPAECDPILIKQVFQNLLANALKFTRPRERSVIQISHRQEDGEVVVAIRDNGVGFNMKYQDKLFGVFQRLHRAEDFEGTGIGLALVQRIVNKHGGRVWAEAELDKGATFYFTLGAVGTNHIRPVEAQPGDAQSTEVTPTGRAHKTAMAGAQV